METVSEALLAFVAPTALFILFALVLQASPFLTRKGWRKRPATGDRMVALTKQIIDARKGDEVDNQPPTSTEILQALPKPWWHSFENKIGAVWLKLLQKCVAPMLLVIATTAATQIGARLLYHPMVSTSYQALYFKFCTADSIQMLLSQKVSATRFANAKVYDGCLPLSAAQSDENELIPEKSDIFFLLESLGLLDSKEKSAKELFAEEPKTKNYKLATDLLKVYRAGMPTSELLAQLAGQVGSSKSVGTGCSNFAEKSQKEASYVRYRTAILSAAMAQQPVEIVGGTSALGWELLSGTGKYFDDLIKNPFDVCDGNASLSKYDLGGHYSFPSGGFWHALVTSRPTNQLNDSEIVSLALNLSGWTADDAVKSSVQDSAEMDFMRAIVSQAKATPSVRDAKIAVNFFVGWERLAILTLVPFLGLCFLWQQMLTLDDSRHLQPIAETVSSAHRQQLSPSGPLAILSSFLGRAYGRSAPREILTAALEVAEQQRKKLEVDFDRASRVADHEMRIVDRSRYFFLAGLPLLPTIGFVGTVRSLIEALSIADNIPRARNAIEQAAAVSEVTSTLSLCFSTTFMALTALLVFAPLDQWQASRERRIVEDTERLLDPGV